MGHHMASSPEECCAACAANNKCGAFTYKVSSGYCYLKHRCEAMQPDDSGNLVSGMPEKLPPPQPPACAIPPEGVNFKCGGGGDIATKYPVKDTSECCDLCMQNPACLMYSFQHSWGNCFLKNSCYDKPYDEDFSTGWADKTKRSSFARYRVGRGVFELEGYRCDGGRRQTVIFYPKGNGPFHVVVYAHGAWGWIDGCDEWLETVASAGLIVLAPFQGSNAQPPASCGSAFAKDVLLAFEGSRAGGAALHPALGTADWSRTGVFGHSRGAKYAPVVAEKGQKLYNITAVLSSGGVPAKLRNISLPAMFTTGELDKYNADGHIRKYFEKVPAAQKVYASLKGAYHMEPQESCHVAKVQEDCDVIYGKGSRSICKVNDYEECVVVGGKAPTITLV